MIDESKSWDFPRHGIKETWFHVMQCPETCEKNKKFIEKSKKEIEKVEVHESCRKYAMLDDVENLINGRNYYKTI